LKRLGRALAWLFVKLRLLVIVAWLGGTVWAAVALPSIGAGPQERARSDRATDLS
jgi:uncharacterized membrane protein YdfJ with MMPL/SSD domain